MMRPVRGLGLGWMLSGKWHQTVSPSDPKAEVQGFEAMATKHSSDSYDLPIANF